MGSLLQRRKEQPDVNMYRRRFLSSRDEKFSTDVKEIKTLAVMPCDFGGIASGGFAVCMVKTQKWSVELADFVNEQDAIHCKRELLAFIENEELDQWIWPDMAGNREVRPVA